MLIARTVLAGRHAYTVLVRSGLAQFALLPAQLILVLAFGATLAACRAAAAELAREAAFTNVTGHGVVSKIAWLAWFTCIAVTVGEGPSGANLTFGIGPVVLLRDQSGGAELAFLDPPGVRLGRVSL